MRLRFPALLAAMVLIAGCGSSTVVTVVETRTVSQASIAGRSIHLPSSPRAQQCVVSHGTTEIIFFSQISRVSGLCRAQVHTGDWQNGYETVSAAPELLFCYLRSTGASVVASVFDVRGGTVGHQACAKLNAGHAWVSAEAGSSS